MFRFVDFGRAFGFEVEIPLMTVLGLSNLVLRFLEIDCGRIRVFWPPDSNIGCGRQ